MKKYLVIPFLMVCLALFLVCQPAHAVRFGFYNITNNDPSDIDVAGQLFVDVIQLEVTEGSNNRVLFWFTNVGPTTSFINEIYFDDGTLLGLAGLIDADDKVSIYPSPPYPGHPGVDYTQDAVDPVKPPDLPGGNSISPAFDITGMFSADTDYPGTGKDGIDEGEWLGIVFDLKTVNGEYLTFADVISDLNSGELRIGLHVQGIDYPEYGKSDSFINNPTSIPDASAVFLLGSACLLGFVGLRKKLFSKHLFQKW
jgi:hypothetical protein